jgi:hypothetical protein
MHLIKDCFMKLKQQYIYVCMMIFSLSFLTLRSVIRTVAENQQVTQCQGKYFVMAVGAGGASPISCEVVLDDTCPICLENIISSEQPLSVKKTLSRIGCCGKLLCADCLNSWVAQAQQPTCPFCRCPHRVEQWYQSCDSVAYCFCVA